MRTNEIESGGREPWAWAVRNGPVLGLALVLVAAATLLLALTSGLTFYQDTWAFLVDRRSFGVDSVLEPHNEHIVVIPVILQQLMLAAFGMTSALPEYILLTVMLCITSVLLFVYVRRRLSPWLALIFAALLIFVGPAWETLLWPFEICFVGSMMFGIATLLALERGDRRGDVAATIFLVVSLGFNSLGLAFVVAAAVDIFQNPRGRRLGRAYVAAVPLLLFAAWYLAFGRKAGSELSLQNVLELPRYVLDSIGASLEALLGLSDSRAGSPAPFEWGRLLVLAFIGLVAFGQWRKPGFSAQLWPVAAAAATYWVLAGLNHSAAREPTSSRYLYASGAMMLLIAANLLVGVRFGRRGLLICGAVAVAAIASNLVILKDGNNYLENQTVLTKANLGAMEIARQTIDPHFVPSPETSGTGSLVNVEAAKYFPAIDEFGSPAYTPSELAEAPAPGPYYADVILSEALPLTALTRPGGYAAGSADCVTLPAGSATPTSETRLAPGLTIIEVGPGPPAAISLRRFAQGEYPATAASAPGNSTTELNIPADIAPQPWYLHLEASQRARVCRPA
jgi:hypothetical protein